MITAETKDGFAVELSEEALDNVELLDALAAVQDSDGLRPHGPHHPLADGQGADQEAL